MNRLRPGEQPSRLRAVAALPLSVMLTFNFLYVVYQVLQPYEFLPPAPLNWIIVAAQIGAFTGLAYLIPWVTKAPAPRLVLSYAIFIAALHFLMGISAEGLVSLSATMILHIRLYIREKEAKAGRK